MLIKFPIKARGSQNGAEAQREHRQVHSYRSDEVKEQVKIFCWITLQGVDVPFKHMLSQPYIFNLAKMVFSQRINLCLFDYFNRT